MYGCNLFLRAAVNWKLGKPGASMYVQPWHLENGGRSDNESAVEQGLFGD